MKGLSTFLPYKLQTESEMSGLLNPPKMISGQVAGVPKYKERGQIVGPEEKAWGQADVPSSGGGWLCPGHLGASPSVLVFLHVRPSRIS